MSADALFEIEKYTGEVRVTEESKASGMTVREVGGAVDAEFVILGLARGKHRVSMPSLYERLMNGDVLLVEGDAEAIKMLTDTLSLEMVGDKELRDEVLKSDTIEVVEAIVSPESYAERRSAGQLDLRRRFGVNLLGVARQGQRVKKRLRDLRLRAGDVLLIQGDSKALQQTMGALGCLPLARRDLQIGRPRRLVLALGLFIAALFTTLIGWLPVQIALTACAAAVVLAGLLTMREAYHAIDWSVILLLGAIIPVGHAMEATGSAQIIADGLGTLSRAYGPAGTIATLLIGTTLLSNVINNAAAAVLMAPIAVQLAKSLSVSSDPFLMAVAVGASSAYLTPIGHQSNTLVLGPGGYRFSDYFRLGLPLTLITWLVGIVLILLFWKPLSTAS